MCDQSSDRHKRNLFFLFFVLFISFSKNKKAIFPHLMFTKCFFPQTQRSRKKIWLMPFEEWHQPTGSAVFFLDFFWIFFRQRSKTETKLSEAILDYKRSLEIVDSAEVCVCVSVCLSVCVSACLSVRVCVIYIAIYTHTRARTHTHAHTHKQVRVKLATVLLLVKRDGEAEKEFDAVLASDVGNQVYSRSLLTL